jgi:hypothetical protein
LIHCFVSASRKLFSHSLGQQRKSVEVAGMSAPGGKADLKFGRPKVRS